MKHKRTRPSPNFDARGVKPIDILLFHYTGMPTAAEALARLCSEDAKVSAHYLVDLDGTVVQMVDEEMRAWHAGLSYWAGETDINARSVGIEIVNPGHEFGYTDFPEAQIEAVLALSLEIVTRHRIPPRRVLGHSDVAPLRKTDPGERFPWRRLAEAGVGQTVPGAASAVGTAADARRFVEDLSAYGYGFLDDPENADRVRAVITAFQRHFDPAAIGSAREGVYNGRTSEILTKLNQD